MPVQLDPDRYEIKALFDCVGSFAGQRVLEVGCGDGRITWSYAAQAGHVTAIDPKAEKISLAKEKMPAELSPQLEFQATDLEQFYKNYGTGRRYDLAILSWSL